MHMILGCTRVRSNKLGLLLLIASILHDCIKAIEGLSDAGL